MASEILIKGMVCERCISVIKQVVSNLGFNIEKISLGKLSFDSEPDAIGKEKISTLLQENGFQLIPNRHVKMVSQVKKMIDGVFNRSSTGNSKVKFSSLLSENLNLNYDSISHTFAQLEGHTLEKYIINRRLEKVKELLVYSDRSLTEIASSTGFSSINHLSRQFKEQLGLTPSHFRKLKSDKQKLTESGKRKVH
jgi:AraC family transcriptional regulator